MYVLLYNLDSKYLYNMCRLEMTNEIQINASRDILQMYYFTGKLDNRMIHDMHIYMYLIDIKYFEREQYEEK